MWVIHNCKKYNNTQGGSSQPQATEDNRSITYYYPTQSKMKFCRNLQRVSLKLPLICPYFPQIFCSSVESTLYIFFDPFTLQYKVIDITDPEWAPYWTNYKMLKKFLKALVPPDAGEGGGKLHRRQSDSSDDREDGSNTHEQGSSEEKKVSTTSATQCASVATTCSTSAAQMSRKPGEVAFFKLLNSELKKAIHFFDQAQLEIGIREARVREGIDIMRKANSLMVTEKWTLMAKSLYRLYKDLLLLETYAIMTYCSFSKILKKHDKVTKHVTRVAFMKNVVNKANFTHYPKLLEMITRCECLYDEVSRSLIQEGKSGLYEDERLFINMIHRLNEQVLDTAETEGAPDTEVRKEHRRSSYSPGQSPHGANEVGGGRSAASSLSSNDQVKTLRSLVEENAMNKSSKDGLARVAESELTIAAMANKDEKKPHAKEVPARQVTGGLSTDEVDGGKRSLDADTNNDMLSPPKRTRTDQ